MSDRFPVQVTFGGTLHRRHLADLANHCTEGYVDWNSAEDTAGWIDVLEECGEDALTAQVTDPEGSYDEFGPLCDWLTAHGLPWRWSEDAKYEYDGEVHVWFPGMDSYAMTTGTQDGEATISLRELREYQADDWTLGRVLAKYAVFERRIPPLVLVGHPNCEECEGETDDETGECPTCAAEEAA
jgi:hypothetical protein